MSRVIQEETGNALRLMGESTDALSERTARRATTVAMSSSREGILDRASTPLASMTSSSMKPPTISNFWFDLANSMATFGAAVKSSE